MMGEARGMNGYRPRQPSAEEIKFRKLASDFSQGNLTSEEEMWIQAQRNRIMTKEENELLKQAEELENHKATSEEKQLFKFTQELRSCLEAALPPSEGNTRSARIDQLVQFETNKKGLDLGLYEYDPQLMDLVNMSAANAASSVVKGLVRTSMTETLGSGNITNATMDRFIEVLENAAKSCGDQDEAEVLGRTEKAIIVAADGEGKAIERSVEMKIPLDIWEVCKEETMNVDFFLASSGLLKNHRQCLSEVSTLSAAFEQEISAVKHEINHHMKQVVVLHNKVNGLGWAMVEHWRRHGLAAHMLAHPAVNEEMHEKLISAATSNLSQRQLMQLKYLEDRHLSSAMAFSVKRFCEKKPTSRYALDGYRSCLCNEKQPEPEMVCQAKHVAEVNKAAQSISEDLEMAHTNFQQRKASLGAVPLIGPCNPPLTCSLCTGNVCVEAAGNNPKNIFSEVEGMLTTEDNGCFSGNCAYAWGSPPQECTLGFNVELGVAAESCDAVSVLTTFHMYIKAEMCLAGTLGAIGDALGWPMCEDIASLKYYPYIGLVEAQMNLPSFFPLVRGQLSVKAPVHDLTQAVTNVVNKVGISYLKVPYLQCQVLKKMGVQMSIRMTGACMTWNMYYSLFNQFQAINPSLATGWLTEANRIYAAALFQDAVGSLDIDLAVQVHTIVFGYQSLHTFDLN